MQIRTRAFQRVVGMANPDTELDLLVEEVNGFVSGLNVNNVCDIQWQVTATGQRATLVYTAFVTYVEME